MLGKIGASKLARIVLEFKVGKIPDICMHVDARFSLNIIEKNRLLKRKIGRMKTKIGRMKRKTKKKWENKGIKK